MKLIILITSIVLTTSIFAQKEPKEWVKKNSSGVVIEKGARQNGKQVGHWSYFYFDGKPSLEVTYKDGVLNGKSIRYDLQGNVIAELNYVDGQLTGKQTYFYQTGQKLSEGDMIDGKEEGAWKYYNQTGEFMGYVKYKNGKQTTEQSK